MGGLTEAGREKRDEPGSLKKASRSAFETHLVSLTSLGEMLILGSCERKRM